MKGGRIAKVDFASGDCVILLSPFLGFHLKRPLNRGKKNSFSVKYSFCPYA